MADSKTMRIVAKSGRLAKVITFPVPAEWNEYMKQISAADSIEVTGSGNVKVFISIYDFGKDL